MRYRYDHLYAGEFRIFESDLSRTFSGATPTDIPDLYAPPSDADWVIVDSGRFNAFASRKADGRSSYGFNLGISLAIFDAVCSLACTEGFCREYPFDCEVGEADVDNPYRFCDYSSQFQDGRFLGYVRGRFIRKSSGPIDRSYRGRLGNHLMEMCLRYISLHEQCHSWLGHVDTANREFGISELHECEPAGEQVDHIPESLLARTLELKADIGAIHTLLMFAPWRGARTTEHGLWLPEANDPLVWTKHVFLAAVVISAILDRADR